MLFGLVFAAGIILGLALTGCGLLNAGKPVAVITSPPSGTQVDTNTDVQVQVSASDNEGIVRIDLLANGVVVASETAPSPGGQPTFSAIVRWTPNTSGQQVVEARAYNRRGDVSPPVAVNILVRDALASATGTPTGCPTLTPSPTATALTWPTPTNTAPPSTSLPPITIVVPTPQPPPPQQPRISAAPSTPSDFKADGSGTTIVFTWDDKSTNELGFRIYQVGEVAAVITLPAHTATGGMSCSWAGRPCSFSASFYIRAYNDADESGSSSSDGAVTIPCQPANLVATGSGLTINFNWSVASSHNESGFHIYQQGVTAAVGTRGPNLGSGGTIVALTGLSCNLVATYSVRAFNTAGESPDSNLIQTETIPCGATNMHITGVSKTTVNYAWTDNATNETGYHVYRDDNLYVTLPAHLGTGTVSSDAFQNCGENHVYAVRAFNYAGESNWSEHVGATTLPFLGGCP